MKKIMPACFVKPGKFQMIDVQHDCVVVEEYGAYMSSINSEEDMKRYYKPEIENGYDICLGPNIAGDTGYGVHCKNYLEIYNKSLERLAHICEVLSRDTSLNSKRVFLLRMMKSSITDNYLLDSIIRKSIQKAKFNVRECENVNILDQDKIAKQLVKINYDNATRGYVAP